MRSEARAPEVAILIGADRDGLPLYTQLYRQLREHILSGALTAGASLPSARTMASDLQLSRNTVEAAISQLRAEGFVSRRVGSGTIVADTRDSAPFARARRTRVVGGPTSGRTQTASPPPSAADPTLSARGHIIAAGGRAEISDDRRASPCTVDVQLFPSRTWQRLLARESRRVGAALLQSADAQGDATLRQAICEHAQLTRGLHCSAEHVLIVNSTQQALDLAGRLLLSDGDVALVEYPCYPAARAVLAGAGADVRGVPVDAHGLDTTALRAHRDARVLYLTPSHQYPLGVTMSLARRLAALAWAQETGAWIIEDDYDSEFRYDGRPIAAMQALDRASRVLYVGTFNKVLFPGMRLAYLILPPTLVDAFTSARRLCDGGSPPLAQAALAAFMNAGHFAAHLRRARRHYGRRRDRLVEVLRTCIGPSLELGPTDTGLHVTIHLPSHVDDVAIAAASVGHGLGVAPLSRYYPQGSGERGLLLSFGAATDADITRAVSVIQNELSAPRSPSRSSSRPPSV